MYGIAYSLSLYVKLLTPSGGLYILNENYLVYSPTMSQSDYHTAILRLPSSVRQELLGRSMVLPSSDIDRSFTRCGLRPRHVNYTLTSIAYIDTDFQKMKPLVSCNVDYFGAQHLHLRYGWQTALTTALHSSLPHYIRSSVPDWWLTFIWAGLSSLLISAYLGALIIIYFFNIT